MKVFALAVLAMLVCRWLLGQWPWDYLRSGGTRANAAARAQRLLGLAPGANRNDIITAHRRLVAMVHPDRGGTSEQVHEANAARDLLLGELPREE